MNNYSIEVSWHYDMYPWLVKNLGPRDRRWYSETWRTENKFDTMMGFRYLDDEILFTTVWGDHCRSLRKIGGGFSPGHFEYYFEKMSKHPWKLDVDYVDYEDEGKWKACHDEMAARLDPEQWSWCHDYRDYAFASREDRDRFHQELVGQGFSCTLDEFDPERFWKEAEYLKNN